jgi:hypothetical protein
MVNRGERELFGRTAATATGESSVSTSSKEDFIPLQRSTSDPSILVGTNKSLLLEASVRASSLVGKRQERKENIVKYQENKERNIGKRVRL